MELIKFIFLSTLALFIFSIIMLINFLKMAKQQPYYKPIGLSSDKMKVKKANNSYMWSEWWLLLAIGIGIAVIVFS